MFEKQIGFFFKDFSFDKCFIFVQMRTGLMSSSTPLVVAACKDHVEVLETLLSDPDIRY